MAAAQSIALSSDDARASLMQDLQREEDLLVRFLCDEDSKDSLRWVSACCARSISIRRKSPARPSRA